MRPYRYNVYVWEHVLKDYTYSMIVVSAPTVEMARCLAQKEHPDEAGLAQEPTCINDRQQIMALFGD